MNASDSSIIKYGRTNKLGAWETAVRFGPSYRLTVSHAGFENVDVYFTVEKSDSNGKKISINLLPAVKTLNSVTVVGNKVKAINFRADTVEYVVDSFLVDANADVEGFLKHLPGFSISREGVITVNGQRIEKLMIDGEEYFSNNQTLVTQTLKADIIDKIQIFDKKTDVAEFTKIDDGKSVKAMNLKLKKDKKNGFFGKLILSKAIESFYDNKFMINKFYGTQKVAAYGVFSNNGRSGLSWQEQAAYSTHSLSTQERVGFDISQHASVLDTWNGVYSNQGLPKVVMGGLHFNDTWLSQASKKRTLNADYQVSDLEIEVLANGSTQYILGDTLLENRSQTKVFNKITSHKIIIGSTMELTDHSDLTFGVDGRVDRKKIVNDFASTLSYNTTEVLNNQLRQINTKGENRYINGSVQYRHRFKNGNSIFWLSKVNLSDNTFSGTLNSLDSFFNQHSYTGKNITDQLKDENIRSMSFSSRITFAKALNKFSNISTYLILAQNKGSDKLMTYSAKGTSFYELDSSFSNSFINRTITPHTGVAFSFIKKAIKVNINIDYGKIFVRQEESFNELLFKRSFNYWNYNSLITVGKSERHNLIFGINGETILPGIRYLQPVASNTNPLNIVVGNPALKPAFKNMIQAHYANYSYTGNSSITMSTALNYYRNAFSSVESIDISGRRIYRYANINGVYDYFMYLTRTQTIVKKVFSVDLTLKTSGYQNKKVINSNEIVTVDNIYGLECAPRLLLSNKYDLLLKFGVNNNRIKSLDQKQHYWNYHIEPELELRISDRFKASSEYLFIQYPKNSFYGSQGSVSNLSMTLSLKVLKANSLYINASVRNALDNKSITTRSNDQNYFNQNTHNTIPRHFLLSLTYSFSKTISKK